MKRWLIRIVCALSLLASVTVMALWLRSDRTQDLLRLSDSRSDGLGIYSAHGLVVAALTILSNPLPYTPVVSLVHNPLDDPAKSVYFSPGDGTIMWDVKSPPDWVHWGFGFTHGQSSAVSPPGTPSFHTFCFAAPHWFVAIFMLLPVLLPLRGWNRRRKRIARRLCVTCGYDLRASSDRCPECGTEIPSSTAPPP